MECPNCFRDFKKLTTHTHMSRCGRYHNNKTTAKDREMIIKVGLDRAIRRRQRK